MPPRTPPATLSPDRAEQKLVGQAIANLRERRRLYQRQIAEALGVTTQAYQKYETGERRFTREKLATILGALEMSEEDLELERARILTGSTAPRAEVLHFPTSDRLMIDVYGRARAGAQGMQVYDVGEPLRQLDLRSLVGPNSSAVEVAGDSMVPWAEPGEVVVFDRDRYPRRGGGCVIETKAGEYYVKLYEKSDGSTLFARELYPEERVITFKMVDLKGVYAIRMRGD